MRIFVLNFSLSLAVAMLIAASGFAAAPDAHALFPAGGQRGTTVQATVSGKNESWPVQAWTSHPGITVTPGEKGKLGIAIAADVVPGLHWIRLYNAEGTSPPQPFVVGTLSESVEAEPNNKAVEAPVSANSSIVINGRLDRSGDVDLVTVPLTAGQTLVASLAGHETLGSPMDAVLHVVSSTGQQIAYNHDGRGLDPELFFTAPADGKYMLRVFGFPSHPNQTIGFSGGDDYLYRLTLTTTGFIDYPWPLAVIRDRSTRVALVGWNIPDALAAVNLLPVGETAVIADTQLANVASVRVEPHATLVEVEPNGADAPQPIPVPSTVSGRIADRGDSDTFSFDAKASQPLSIDVESREIGFPLDAVLTITDATGKSLARIDDVGGRDASTLFSPPADGSYRVSVSDLNRDGSPRHVYRLRVVPATPTFEVTADANAYTVAPGKPAEITLAVDRRHGFGEEISFAIQDLPDSITVAPTKSAAEGDTAKSVKLVLTGNGTSASGPIRIGAQSLGSSGVKRLVTAAITNHTSRVPDLWLTSIAAPPTKPAEPAKP